MPWNKDRSNPGLQEQEVLAIVARARQEISFNMSSRYADRWAPFFSTLWWTGRRLGEVLAITRADVRPSELRYMPEKVKFPVPMICYLPPRLSVELQVLATAHHLGPHDRIFPMTRSGCDKALKRIARAAGILRHVHSHMFRHGHGRHLARDMVSRGNAGIAIEGAIKGTLGHRSWATQRQYLEPSQAELAEHVRRAFGTEDR